MCSTQRLPVVSVNSYCYRGIRFFSDSCFFFNIFSTFFLLLSRGETIDFTFFYEIVRHAAISPWDVLLCILLKMRTSWISPWDVLLHFLIVIWKHFWERQISALYMLSTFDTRNEHVKKTRKNTESIRQRPYGVPARCHHLGVPKS